MYSGPWAQPAFSGKFTKVQSKKEPILLPLSCNTSTWEVNKLQFNANSRFFERLFGSSTRRSTTTYQLAEADENAVAAVVRYLITGNYAARPVKDRDIPIPIYHLRVLVASITYEASGLGKLASDNFATCFWPGFWETDDFAATAEHVFASSFFSHAHLRLRDHYCTLVIETMKDHTMEILARDVRYTRLNALIRTTPELAYQLLRFVALLPARASTTGLHDLGPGLATSPASLLTSSTRTPVTTAVADPPHQGSSDPDEPELERVLPNAPATRHNAGFLQRSTFAPSHTQSRKRKREPSPSFADRFKRFSRKCTICEAKFETFLPWSRDDIHSRQCRTCADQLERQINFDEHDEFGRRLF